MIVLLQGLEIVRESVYFSIGVSSFLLVLNDFLSTSLEVDIIKVLLSVHVLTLSTKGLALRFLIVGE